MSVNTKVNGELVKSAGLYKASVPIQSGDIYSLEERQVGVWHNGKPLYQKTIYISALPSAKGTGTYSTGVSGVEACWLVDATTGTSNLDMMRVNETDASAFQSASIYARCASVGGDLTVYVDVGRDRSSLSAYVTVRYTKTTDVAGSGEYVPSGDKAVHYSTDEEVIGTWIDGSTLYRRAIPITSNWELQANTWVKSNISASGIDYFVNGRLIVEYQGAKSLHFLQIAQIDGYIAGNCFRSMSGTIGSYLIIEYTKSSS